MNTKVVVVFLIHTFTALVKTAELMNTGFKVTSIRSTVFYVEWNEVDGKKYEATSLFSTVSVDCPYQPPRTDQSSPNSIITIWNGDPIEPSTSYRLCLLVENIPDDNVNENDYAVIRNITSAPGPPSSVNIDYTTSSTFHITWNHVNPDATTNYRVTYTNDGSSMTKNTTDTTTSLLVDRLNSNNNYNVRVAALTSELKTASDESQAIEATTVPLQVNILSTESTNSTSIPVQWEALTEGNLPITYNVNWTSAEGEGSETSIDGNYTVLCNMKSNTDYNITVEATNKGGTGIPSNAASATTRPEKANQPSNSSLPTNSTISLQWNEVDEGNSTRNYTVEWSSIGTGGGMKEGIQTNSTIIEELEANTKYSFTVTAVNIAGPGEASSPITFFTVPGIPTHVTVDSDSQKPTTDVVVSWMKPSEGKALDEYFLEWWPVTNITAKQFNTSFHEAGKDSYDYDITDLTPGESYGFNVQARNSAGTGQSSIRCFTTDPRPVKNLSVVQNSENPTTTLNVTWRTPEGTGGNITVSCTNNDGQTVNRKTSFTSTFTSCVVEPGYNYTVSAAALSKDKTSAKKATEMNTKPAAVKITASSVSSITISIKWLPVEGFAQFIVIESLNQSSLQTVILDGTSTDVTITGLIPQTNYTISIFSRITNIEGKTEESEKTIFYEVTDAKQSGTDVGLIIGVVIAAVFVIIFLVGGFFFYKKHKLQPKTRFNQDNGMLFANKRLVARSAKMISLSKLKQMIKGLTIPEIINEFQSIRATTIESYTCLSANSSINKTKNRHNNFLPFDKSRVLLPSRLSKEGSDYINASWISGFDSASGYIAAQTPLPNTMTDFWRLVWDQNTSEIVLLCKMVENGNVECDCYWPDDETPITCNKFSIQLLSEKPSQSWITRKLKLSQDGHVRIINQFHFTGWNQTDESNNDELVQNLVLFIKLIRNEANKEEDQPVIVQCRNGSGRSGVFIAVNILLDQMEENSAMEVYDVVTRMRECRPMMIENQNQYLILYKVVGSFLSNAYEDVLPKLNPDRNSLYINTNINQVVYETIQESDSKYEEVRV